MAATKQAAGTTKAKVGADWRCLMVLVLVMVQETGQGTGMGMHGWMEAGEGVVRPSKYEWRQLGNRRDRVSSTL